MRGKRGRKGLDDKKCAKIALRLGTALLAAVAAWLFFKYALRWLLPFMLALLAARVAEPAVAFFKKRAHIARPVSAAVFTVLMAALLAAGAALACLKAAEWAGVALKKLPEALETLPEKLRWAEERVRSFADGASPEAAKLLEKLTDGLLESVKELPGRLTGKVFSILSTCAGGAPGAALFFISFGVGTFFISSSYPTVTGFLVKQFPERMQENVRRIRSDIFGTLGAWVRAQLILMAVCFAELGAGFLLLGVGGALRMALVTALIDALPVFGVGTVLLPWALAKLLTGEYAMAAALAALYAIVSLVRSFLEPKVLSARVGLHPAAALAAMYMGFRFLGVGGMVAFPLLLMVLKQLNDKGYVKLWK